MPPIRGSTQGRLLRLMYDKSGRNIEVFANKLHLDTDTAAELLDNAMRGRVPVRGQDAKETLQDLINGAIELGGGPREAKQTKETFGAEYVMRYYRLTLDNHIPRDVANRATKFIIMVHGTLDGQSKWISHTGAGDIETAWLALARVVKDYSGRFEADADGFEVKVFEYLGEE